MKNVTAKDIDALLPQTQCGLCSYKGCMPYAEALAKQAASIDLCPPGGVDNLIALGNLLDIDPSPYIPEMEKKAKPKMLAVIREAECIGCTKCISACPVDAILGGAKLMHTVITSECTGCELCIAPCPVDCIDMLENTDNENKADYYRDRYLAKNERLSQEKRKSSSTKTYQTIPMESSGKKDYIQAALLRVKNKIRHS